VAAAGNPALERELRQMSIYDFNFRILALKKNQDVQSNKLENEPFGLR
jgi:hypothetical protein